MQFSPLHWVGKALARYLSKPRDARSHVTTSQPSLLAETLRKGDVLLVEGSSRFATAICYLTQSTWSHSALYVGDALPASPDGNRQWLVEADINDGVRAVPMHAYAALHTRICRPVGLTASEIDQLVAYALKRIGNRYDLRNVFDLARYLVATPPVPNQMRRQMIALGSGDPTRAICSSLIAEAFESVHYPILPNIEVVNQRGADGRCHAREILHIRHSSLYMPRDFDVSPYFQIIKPMLERNFDPHRVNWAPRSLGDAAPSDPHV